MSDRPGESIHAKEPPFLKSWLPAFLWMALIFGLSSIRGSDLPKIPAFDVSSYVHVVEYLVLGILLLRGFRNSFPGKSLFLLAIIAACSAILFGTSDEWHQTFVSGRFCDPIDLIVDAISAALGILLYIRRTGLSSPKG